MKVRHTFMRFNSVSLLQGLHPDTYMTVKISAGLNYMKNTY